MACTKKSVAVPPGLRVSPQRSGPSGRRHAGRVRPRRQPDRDAAADYAPNALGTGILGPGQSRPGLGFAERILGIPLQDADPRRKHSAPGGPACCRCPHVSPKQRPPDTPAAWSGIRQPARQPGRRRPGPPRPRQGLPQPPTAAGPPAAQSKAPRGLRRGGGFDALGHRWPSRRAGRWPRLRHRCASARPRGRVGRSAGAPCAMTPRPRGRPCGDAPCVHWPRRS